MCSVNPPRAEKTLTQPTSCFFVLVEKVVVHVKVFRGFMKVLLWTVNIKFHLTYQIPREYMKEPLNDFRCIEYLLALEPINLSVTLFSRPKGVDFREMINPTSSGSK